MANANLGYQEPDTIDKLLDAESLTVGADTVYRERIQISGSGAAEIAPVSATDGLLVNLGANNDVTVAGVSTAANQTTIIGHLDGVEGLLTTIDADTGSILLAVDGIEALLTTIDTDTGSILSAVDGVEALLTTIDADTSNIATSVANIDTDTTTIIGHLDGVEGLLGTIDADTGGILTSVQLIDNAATTIGTTDVLRVALFDNANNQVTSFGGGTQYTEADTDASITGTAMMMEGAANALVPAQGTAADGLLVNLGSNNDVVVSATDLDIRNLTNTDVVTAELSATDNAVLDAIAASVAAIDTDATTIIGHVDGIEGLLTTIDADTGSIMTAVQLLDDAVQVLGTDTYTETTSKGITIGAVRRDADTTLVGTTNEFGPLQMDANGRLKVEVFSGEALPITDNSSSISVDWNGTQPVTGSGTATGALRVELPTNGTGIVGLAAGTNNIGDIDVLSVIPGTGTTNLGKAEDAGHTTGDTGIYNLGVRNDTPNTATTNTDADYSSITTDRVGGIRTALYETDFAVLGTNHVKKYYTNAGAVTDGIVWSPAAGKRWYVTDIFINVSAAATVTLEDDKAGGDEVVWKAELAANSGWSHHFQTPLFSGEDAADLLVTTSAGNVYITITGYEI